MSALLTEDEAARIYDDHERSWPKCAEYEQAHAAGTEFEAKAERSAHAVAKAQHARDVALVAKALDECAERLAREGARAGGSSEGARHTYAAMRRLWEAMTTDAPATGPRGDQ